MNEYLNKLLISSMLKTSKEHCKDMYKKSNIDIIDYLDALEDVVASFAFYCYITPKMADNIHLIYDNLLNDNPDYCIDIVESYNFVKGS